MAAADVSVGKALVAVSIAGLTVQVVGEMVDVMALRTELFDSEEMKANPKVGRHRLLPHTAEPSCTPHPPIAVPRDEQEVQGNVREGHQDGIP